MKITAEQQRGLEMVKEYAKEKGIEISITIVKERETFVQTEVRQKEILCFSARTI